jgi:hypothetical protein
MARIAILGWGSLTYDLGDLITHVRMPWSRGGPLLPLEFSRVSKSRRNALTLVIDPENGINLPTQFIESTRRDPMDAACDLRRREGTVISHIGLVDLDSNLGRRSKTEKITEAITLWARQCGFRAVVWTDLCSNFAKENGVKFLDRESYHLSQGAAGRLCYRSPTVHLQRA